MDNEASRFFKALVKQLDPGYLRTLRQNTTTTVDKINGYLIERWFIKTLINHIYGFAYKGIEKPPDYLVQMAFNQLKFPEGFGLLTCRRTGLNPIPFEQGVLIVPITNIATDELAAGLFEFSGWRFVIPTVVDWKLSDIWNVKRDQSLKSTPEAESVITWATTSDVASHLRTYSVRVNGVNITANIEIDWNSNVSIPIVFSPLIRPWIVRDVNHFQ
ncbi:hypothetical protein DD509_06880 [Dehalogenimonas alkenigignens]|nr:hypothetical protein DD509_06880 [Dehalogenimonas alkenigignens]